MKKEMDESWRELSEALLTDMKEWRTAHPNATFREIEDEVRARMSHLEAQIIQDTAQQSPWNSWSDTPREQRPRCPVCQTPLSARGKHQRRLQGIGGHDVTLTRDYGTCSQCGTGLFPPR